MVQIFCIVFELCKYHKIPQIQNVRLAAILKLFPPKGYSPRLSDIAEHLNYQIKKKIDGIFFMKRANEHFFVSHRSN